MRFITIGWISFLVSTHLKVKHVVKRTKGSKVPNLTHVHRFSSKEHCGKT